MGLVMLVQLEVLRHSNEAYNSHPGAPEVAALWGGLSCFEKQDHSLHCTQTRYILETFLVLFITLDGTFGELLEH
jgi:hypothetical protein